MTSVSFPRPSLILACANPNHPVFAVVPLENYEIKKPVFFGGAREDYIVVYWAHEASTRRFCPNLTVVHFDENHWVASQAPTEVNHALEKWITEVVLA